MDGYGPHGDLGEEAAVPDHATGQPEPTEQPTIPTPIPPATGDAQTDAVLGELAQAQQGSLADRIEAGERTHRALRDRLSDLGGQ